MPVFLLRKNSMFIIYHNNIVQNKKRRRKIHGTKDTLYRERKNSGTYISGYLRRCDRYLPQSQTNT